MLKFKVNDLVYISPFVYPIIYDINKPSYPITNIETEKVWEQQGYGTSNGNYVDKYEYSVDVDGETKQFTKVMALPNITIDGTNITDFKINGKTINKIEIDEGNWTFIEGKGYQPQYPNRHKYTLSDGSIVENSDYKILSKLSLGGKRRRTRKNRKSKKSKKSRKSNRRRHK